MDETVIFELSGDSEDNDDHLGGDSEDDEDDDNASSKETNEEDEVRDQLVGQVKKSNGAFGDVLKKKELLKQVVTSLVSHSFRATCDNKAFNLIVAAIEIRSKAKAQSATFLAECIVDLALALLSLYEADPKAEARFAERGGDKHLLKFAGLCKALTASVLSAGSSNGTGKKVLTVPYHYGFIGGVQVDRRQVPLCCGCGHDALIQIKSDLELQAINLSINVDNERVKNIFDARGLGRSGLTVKKEPAPKPNEQHTIQCACLTRKCLLNPLTNFNCMPCTKKARAGDTTPTRRCERGFVHCTCPYCECNCTMAFKVSGDGRERARVVVLNKDYC